MRDSGGFTLIELMIVVAIIGILGGTALPSFEKKRDEARGLYRLSIIRGLQSEFREFDWDGDSIDDYAANVSELTTFTSDTLKESLEDKTYYILSLSGSGSTFTALASPTVPGVTGDRWFFLDVKSDGSYEITQGSATVQYLIPDPPP